MVQLSGIPTKMNTVNFKFHRNMMGYSPYEMGNYFGVDNLRGLNGILENIKLPEINGVYEVGIAASSETLLTR